MKRSLDILVAFALLAATHGAVADATKSEPATFRVIVHAGNPVGTLSRKFVADAFLKKRTRWVRDRVIYPADLHARSAVRRRFSRAVLSRSVAAVRRYWQRIVFSGRGVPPPELRDDDAVMAYVRRHPGGIGYVSSNANLVGVRVVEVR